MTLVRRIVLDWLDLEYQYNKRDSFKLDLNVVFVLINFGWGLLVFLVAGGSLNESNWSLRRYKKKRLVLWLYQNTYMYSYVYWLSSILE